MVCQRPPAPGGLDKETLVASPQPAKPSGGDVPAAIRGVNRLAVTSFLLSLASVGAGLVAFGLVNLPLGTSDSLYLPASNDAAAAAGWVFVGGIAANIVAIVMAGMSLRRAKELPHEQARRGYAQAGLAIGIGCLILLICVGSFYAAAGAFAARGVSEKGTSAYLVHD